MTQKNNYNHRHTKVHVRLNNLLLYIDDTQKSNYNPQTHKKVIIIHRHTKVICQTE